MTTTMPTIDISMVTYNSARWIESFLDSLLKQSWPAASLSLLWRDNGSSDDTMRILQRLQGEHGRKFARFEIEQGENIGFGAGHNANFKQVRADFFLVTNVDLTFERDTLRVLIEKSGADQKQTAAWECRQKPFEHPKEYHPVTGLTLWSSSACILFRTSAFRAVGGYDAALFMYGEDVDLSYRLRDAGYALRYVPQATVWHYTYESGGEVKPLQFLGSTLANVLLRCRFGSFREILTGLMMYLGLFLLTPRFPKQRRGLLRNAGRLLRRLPHFLATRRRSAADFPFRLWDYAAIREGAFYSYPEPQPEAGRQPVVSVLVRTMPGRAGKLQEAIASIVGQTYAAIELVVAEDGGASARETCDELRRSGRFVGVSYLPLDKQGRCRAGNAALAAATGELCCFLDDDDLFYADHLEVLVGEWQKQPALGAVYGLGAQLRTEVISEEPWRYRDLDCRVIYRQEFNRALLWHHNYLPIQTVLFQRQLYLEHGGFDPDLDNLEDWNLWVRYSLRHEFRLVPKTTSLYRIPAVPEKALQRQQVLDDYYAKAQARHAQLRVELSPPQVVEMARSLAPELYVIGIPADWLRNRILSLPGIRWFYHPARALRNLMRRLRAG